MEQYISKSAVVAEIAKRVKEAEIILRDVPSSAIFGLTQAYKNVLSLLDTKEVVEISKDLNWQDIKLISEIGESFMNSDESNSLSEEEYYTEILKRFKNDKRKSQTNN